MGTSAERIEPESGDPLLVSFTTTDLKHHSVRGSFATVLSQVAKLAIQLISQVILARLLFPAEYGLVAMAYPIVAFLQVFNDIGLAQAVIQRPTLEQAQVSALFWITIVISLVLTFIVAILAPLAAWVYHEPRLFFLTIVLGLVFPVTAIGIVPNAIMARHMQFGRMARNEVVAMFAGAIITVLAAWLGLSYWSLLVGQLCNAMTGSILVWISIPWRPKVPKLLKSSWTDMKFGANITLSNLATFATTSGDNMIVGLTAGKAQLGLYDRSYNLVVRPIGQMMTPLSRVALPLLSRLIDNPQEYRAAYLEIFRIAILLIVPAMLVCISDGNLLIELFLGPRWNDAVPIFSWLCVGGLTSGIYASTFWLFISQDRARELRIYSALGAAVNVISYFIGAFWGVVGIATAASTGFIFVSTPLLFYAATRKGPVRRSDVLRCGTPFILNGALVYLVLKFGVQQGAFTGVLRLAVVTVLSYAMFFTLSLAVPANRRLYRQGMRLLKGLRISTVQLH